MRLMVLTFLILPAILYGQGRKPVITGQRPLATNEEQSLAIALDDLYVTDPDNWFYPWGFSLAVYPGENYTLSGNTVIPNVNFNGTLSVGVTVNDGRHDSDVYFVQIPVNPVNDSPVISGQAQLATGAGVPLEINLTHLTVTDPDNTYPQDFTLAITAGPNYSVTGTTVTPSANFSGMLEVNTTVRDGIASSPTYLLKIDVTKGVIITGQKTLQINEDETTTLSLEDLVVNDPTGVYPAGYKLVVSAGENFTVDGLSITPALNFAGTLSIPVSITNGGEASNSYPFQLSVVAVNDAPEILDLETEALPYAYGSLPVPVSQRLVVTDVDDTQLVLAEIGFRGEYYQEGSDSLHFDNLTAIRGVFDPREGILSLIGVASLEEYQVALRAVRYSNRSQDDAHTQKVFYIKINDGENVSVVYERSIVMSEDIALEIPNAFTPNSDLANDTWRIQAFEKSEKVTQAVVRVYNKRGMLVYEAQGFEHEWDGRFKGELLPADTYFYTIDLNLAHSKTNFKGAVTILR